MRAPGFNVKGGTLILTVIVLISLLSVMVIFSRPQQQYSAPAFTAADSLVQTADSREPQSYRYFVRSITVSAVFLLLLYIVARVLKANSPATMGKGPDFTVLSRKHLDPKHQVHLVRSYGRYLLLSVTEQSMNVLMEVDPESVENAGSDAGTEATGLKSFAGILKNLTGGKGE